jgi:hypothetical protein
MKLHPVMAEAGNPEFGDATVALKVGGNTFIGTFRGDRIAYFPSKSEAPSPAAAGSSAPAAK